MSRIINRSNSDLTAIEMIMNNTTMSPQSRMYAIADITSRWATSSGTDPAFHSAAKEYAQRKNNGTLYGSLK